MLLLDITREVAWDSREKPAAEDLATAQEYFLV
jgi:hypothetical protein